jgi:archaellum biogenesis protein FlaJ (TadC family)
MSNQFSHEKIIQLRKKRSAADRRFKTYGLIATVIGMAILFFFIIYNFF